MNPGSYLPHRIDTAHGPLCAYASSEAGSRSSPNCLFLHGALRGADALRPVTQVSEFRYRSILIDLPGHGASFHPTEVTIDTLSNPIADIVRDALSKEPCVVVGESLGGLVALRLAQKPPPNLIAVVAVDPLLDTAKLRHVHDTMRLVLSLYPEHPFLTALAENIFGVRPDRPQPINRSYHHLLAGLQVPALVLTGDKRPPVHQFDEPGTCMLDEGDLAHLAGQASNCLSVEVLAGSGHLALTEQPAQCLRAVANFVQRVSGH